MERRLEKFGDVVEKFLQESDLAFATIDNINIYRGIVTHARLFKRLWPKMWNFTGRYLLRPKLSAISRDFLTKKEICKDPQKPIENVAVEDVIIGKIIWF